jgi:hypothetical protein
MRIGCVGNNHAKKQVQLIFKTHFDIFCISTCKPKYSCTIMYTCEKSPPLHELSYLGLFKFSYLNLFHINVICRK